MPDLDDVYVVELQRPGLPGTGITTAEKTQITSDIAALQARPQVSVLNDLTDVDTAGVATGQTLIYDDAQTPPWRVGTPSTGITVDQQGAEVVLAGQTRLSFRDGFTVEPHGSIPNYAIVRPVFGGTGEATAAAPEDHAHALPLIPDYTFAASGVLSSGTRTLFGQTITGLDPAKSYTFIAELYVTFRNNVNAGRVTFSIEINAGSPVTRAVTERCVGGVDRSSYVKARRQNAGLSSFSVTARAQYVDGDPSDIGAGWVAVTAEPNR